MKKRTKPVTVLFLLAALAAVAIGLWFTLVAWPSPSTKQAAGDKPAMVEAYERLFAAYNGAAVEELEPPSLDPFPEDALDIIAGYERLFARMEQGVNASGGLDLKRLPGSEPQEWTDEETSTVEQFLDKNREFVREIREMAERGGPVYALDFSKGFEMDLPHLSPMRSCARVLEADAVVKGMEGNNSEAVEDIIAGMKLGEALSLEPVLPSQLVRIAICGIMHSAVWDSFDGGDLPPGVTRKLIAQLARGHHREAFAEALRGEQYMGLDVFSRVKDGDRAMLRAWGGSLNYGDTVEEWAQAIFLWWYASPFGRPWLDKDEASYVDIMSRVANAAKMPYYEAYAHLTQIERDIRDLPRTRVVSGRVVLALLRAFEAQARHEAMLDLMQIGILVEQYKARTGSFPGTLDAIAADLGGSVPVDPFSGKSYRYRPLGEKFLLYSIGANRFDDGGTHDYREGDIVWRAREEL